MAGMSPGPLRRLSGALGLLALLPTAYLLAVGAITLLEGAWRASATLLAVVVVGRLASWIITGLARSFERVPPGSEQEQDGGTGHVAGDGNPGQEAAVST